jgi:hypothetical protein
MVKNKLEQEPTLPDPHRVLNVGQRAGNQISIRLVLRLGFVLTLAAFLMPNFPNIASAADNPLSPSASFAGIFSDGKLTVELSESNGAYVGMIKLGNDKFPTKASVTRQGLAGTFTASGNQYTFTTTLSGGRLIFLTGDRTYTLAKVATNPLAGDGAAAAPHNPLSSQPGPAVIPAAGVESGRSAVPDGFSVLGATQEGETLFVKLPSAQTLELAITQTASKLGNLFDAKPALGGAFADAKTKRRGGALLTAKVKGQDIRGWIFCSLASPGATASIVYVAANASQSDVATLFAFMPAQVKMQEHVFPDGSGSIDLPPGWTTTQQSASFGVFIKGPAGQLVAIGNSVLVNTPDGLLARTGQQTYQTSLQSYKMQLQAYQQNVAAQRQYPNILALKEPKKPVPPDPARDMPQLIFCRYCSGADEVLQYLYPAMEERARRAGGPYSTLDRIIEVVPTNPNPLIANDKAGVAYLALTDHDGNNATQMRVMNRIGTYPVLDDKSTWVVVFNTMRAPDTTFDRDLPVMNDIMTSFKMNMEVVNRQIEQNGAAVRKMGEDSERQLLKQARGFNQQQAENFDRFESQQRAREQARHDSNSDFIEYINGVRDVYDSRTGQMHSVDLFNVNGIVEGMNAGANDPNRFVQIPLRYER